MLAREFKTADQLELPQDVYDALVAFTREDDVVGFSLKRRNACVLCYVDKNIGRDVGTPADYDTGRVACPPLLARIGYPHFFDGSNSIVPDEATLRQAQEAVRNALSFGDPMWAHVLAPEAT